MTALLTICFVVFAIYVSARLYEQDERIAKLEHPFLRDEEE